MILYVAVRHNVEDMASDRLVSASGFEPETL